MPRYRGSLMQYQALKQQLESKVPRFKQEHDATQAKDGATWRCNGKPKHGTDSAKLVVDDGGARLVVFAGTSINYKLDFTMGTPEELVVSICALVAFHIK